MAAPSSMSMQVRRFLLSILCDLVNDNNFKPCFKGAHRDIHLFFWGLKQNGQYSPFVDELLFDINGNYPHSEQIDELLQELQLAGILSRPNPTYKYNDIAIRSDSSAQEFRNSLTQGQKEAYTKILEQFKRDLGVRRPPSGT